MINKYNQTKLDIASYFSLVFTKKKGKGRVCDVLQTLFVKPWLLNKV